MSVEGRRSRSRYLSSTQCGLVLGPKPLNNAHGDSVVGRDEPPQTSSRYLSILPQGNAFTSRFHSSTTTRSWAKKEGDGARIKNSNTSPQLSGTTPDTRNLYSNLHGLGSWVIIPDELQPHPVFETSPVLKRGENGRENTKADAIWAGKFAMRTTVAREGSLLALTLDYTRYLHEALGGQILHGSDTLLELIEIVFTPRRSWKLEQRGFQAEDVVCWGWILAADAADTAVKRMHVVANLATYGQDAAPVSALPYFLFTIILRSRMLSGSSLTLLVNVLVIRLQRGVISISDLPDATTAMIILVRLVRHARRVAPAQLPAIAELSGPLLRAEHVSNPSSGAILSRLTHNYNRMLSIFSIATSQHPFRFITVQQRAQLKVVRQMAMMDPALPVTREGYQAMIKVQLAHKKTSAEQVWARTKASSWPPWRKDTLGISEDVEYPGSQSRALDVLHRQIEAGYMQTDWDRAARVLAGWDTDKSPTIQTRAVLDRAPLTWLQSLIESLIKPVSEKRLGSTEAPGVWTARIRATRTMREAWVCFCAWDASSAPNGRTQSPYLAMFDKLAPRLQKTDPGLAQLPGDGKEVHAQSISPRDYLYVPVEPPSFHAFYDKMRLDDVKPGGRLLSLLLDHARTLPEGIMYLEQSTFTEIKKDVLLNAHKYDANLIRSELKYMRPLVLASFLTMIWRTRRGSGKTWFHPTFQAANDPLEPSNSVVPEEVSAHVYVLDLLKYIQLSTQFGNKIMATIAHDLMVTTDMRALGVGWRALLALLERMKASGSNTDMATFYIVVSVIEHIIITRPDYRFRLHPESHQKSKSNSLTLARTLFVQAIIDPTPDVLSFSRDASTSSQSRFTIRPDSKITYLERQNSDEEAMRMSWLPLSADSSILEVPSPAALHLLMRVLYRGGETGSVLRLLRWMARFSKELVSVRNQMGNGERQMRCAMCVAAMAIEDDSANDQPVPAAEIWAVRKLIEENGALGGWPTDEELEGYLMKGRPADRQRQHGNEEGGVGRQ